MNAITLAKRQEVITKFYGGKRKPYMHRFDIRTGDCDFCHKFIGKCTSRMCSVITSDEVSGFRIEDIR